MRSISSTVSSQQPCSLIEPMTPDAILDAGAEPVITPKRHRKHQHAYDKTLYKERNVIERFFNKLKQFRRVATRYDKLFINFMGWVKIAAIAIWLR